MSELVFRPSRIKAMGASLICAAGWWFTWKSLGDESYSSALGSGGMIARVAIGNILFTFLAPLALMKGVIRPSCLVINAHGVEERGMFRRFSCRWHEIKQIDLTNVYGNPFVQIYTGERVSLLGSGYGPSPQKLAETLHEYRDAAMKQWRGV